MRFEEDIHDGTGREPRGPDMLVMVDLVCTSEMEEVEEVKGENVRGR